MTALLALLKNPKNLLIVILAVLVLAVGAVVLIQRASLAKQKSQVQLQAAEIERYKTAQKAYSQLIDDYAAQVVKWQKLSEKQQAVENQTAKEVVKIKYIKSDCKVEKEDAKIVNGVAEYFNTGRLRDN